jgi:hypothetical protein
VPIRDYRRSANGRGAGLGRQRDGIENARGADSIKAVPAGTQRRELRDRVIGRTRQRENPRLDEAVVVPAVLKTRAVEQLGWGGVGDALDRAKHQEDKDAKRHAEPRPRCG